MVDLNAMAIFAQVVQSGSFSAAAKRLAMPLSTVSRKISELESSLNAKLLERSTRSLRLTEIGTIYYDHCRRGMEEFSTANLLVENRQNEVSGVLRISLPPNLAESLFIPIIGLFQKQYPKTKIEVLISERIVDLVEDGVDLSFRVGPLRDSSLIARRLLSYRHVLVASPAYLAKYGSPESPSELAMHRLIAFGFWGEKKKQWTMLNGKKKETLTFEPVVSINDYLAIQHAVTLNQGVAEIPFVLCKESLGQNIMVEVLPEWSFREINLQVVHTGTKNMSRLMRLFVDACIQYFSVFAGEKIPSISPQK